jgi:hypothetical protein
MKVLSPSKDLVMSSINPEILYLARRTAGSFYGSLNMTTDGGENWAQIDSTLKELDNANSISSILLDDNLEGRLYVGMLDYGQPLTDNFSNGGLFLTEDNGKSWKKIYDSEVNVITADNESPRNIYVGTKFGIKTFIDTFTVTSVKEVQTDKPEEFELIQNYPNPFNPATTISYTIEKDDHVNLVVYDVLGRQVLELVNEQQKAGDHSIKFSAVNLSSGIYYCRLQTTNSVKTNKMILSK